MKKYGDIFYKFLWIWLILVQIGCTNQSELKVIKPIVLPESDTVLNGNVYRAKVYIENADQLQNALLNADGISYSFKYEVDVDGDQVYIPNLSQQAVVVGDTTYLEIPTKIDSLGTGEIATYYWFSCINVKLMGGLDTTFCQMNYFYVKGTEHPYAETFTDSTQIGQSGKNKVIATQFQEDDQMFMNVKFFTTNIDEWVLQNDFTFEKDGVTGIDPIVDDLNGDGYNDFMVTSSLAARGSNEIRTLFIYDPTGDSLVLIKNSWMYPNLQYNESMDCITAMLYYRCNSQAFLEVSGDSLRPFAWIHNNDDFKVLEVDENGNETVLRYDSISPYECYTYFETLNQALAGKSSTGLDERLYLDIDGLGKEEVLFFLTHDSGCRQLIIKGGDLKDEIRIGCETANALVGHKDFRWVEDWKIQQEGKTYEIYFAKNGDVEGSRDMIMENKGIFLTEYDPKCSGIITFIKDELVWIHQCD